ncbi:MAG: SUMF1/EgtB/PvdO family nonheme iron enzyme [Ignavibacteriales bacterium]|nr:SUMF1/EgtB/PvdO family nonheme iron enzyme [Ignavibacteria bacterium]MCZ2144196.1 SUMF1/EgtB/PvdO family nonheme iron enzyme [Ignavibacteriales bacterium]
MTGRFVKISLFITLFTTLLHPQLKELIVRPTENRGGIPILRNNPDQAGIIFYSQFDNLSFYSTYGITKITGDPEHGKYILVIEPTRQTIEVRAPGYKTEMIKIYSIEPREFLFYEVLPKKEEITGVAEVAITVQATPTDATILLDGAAFPNNTTTKVSVGTHNLTVEKGGYAPYSQEIEVTAENTFFQISLQKVQLTPVTIKSNPTNATVYINNEKKGTTEVGFFLFPGEYDIRLELPDYITFTEKINIRPSDDNSVNTFSYNLTKNKGNLELSVTPSNATIRLNGNNITRGNHELSPGKYQLEVVADLYFTHSEEIEIKRGETIKKEITLTKTTGILKLSLTPANASISINKERKYGNEFELIQGVYEVEISAETYYPETFTVEIERGKTVNKTIKLIQKTGTLQFTVKPPSAEVILKQNGVDKYRWQGLKLLNSIPVGEYDLETKTEGYKSYKGVITIKENQTTVTEIEMTPGSDAPEMVFVEGGTFTMGCTSEQGNDCDSDEKPAHQVILSDFYMGKYEVTVEMFSEFIEATGYKTEADKGGGSRIWTGSEWKETAGVNWRCDVNGKIRYESENNHPVIHVSWNDAVSFCNWLSDREGLQRAYSGSGDNITCNFSSNGYRLPTEAEWEYAARGGKQTKNYKYSGSDNTGAVAWYGDNSGGKTHAVGLKQPNEIGIYDMSGNVWEWCWDWYGDYTSPSQTNPKGPSSGTSRVLRGGSWGNDARRCRVASRGNLLPDIRYSNNGFRLARTR